MTASDQYFTQTITILNHLKETQSEVIGQAADVCAQSILKGGLVFLFGAGHSRMMCEEMTPRQGGFVGFFAMVEASFSTHHNIIGLDGLRSALHIEKYEGLAEQILQSFKFGPHDSFIIISTSGIRPIIVEMARAVKERGLPLTAILSQQHCQKAKPAHSSGQKLIDYADLIIDKGTPPGDCVLGLEGLEWKTGPVSTISGA